MSLPDRHLSLSIAVSGTEGTMFRAGLRLTRLPIGDLNLVKLFFSYPLLTLHVIGGIHWQALRLWLKGAGYRKRPEPGPMDVTIVNATELTT
jgi:DUF1365 family protein